MLSSNVASLAGEITKRHAATERSGELLGRAMSRPLGGPPAWPMRDHPHPKEGAYSLTGGERRAIIVASPKGIEMIRGQ